MRGGVVDGIARLEQARESFRREAWADACDAFSSLDRVRPLGIEDLEQLGEAAHILGRGDEAIAVLQRVYRAHVDVGEIGRALRCAFWLWHALTFKGEFAHAGGWVARAGRLAETGPECAERGYLLIPEAERRFGEGDHAAAFAVAGRAVELGSACGDRDLVTVAAHIQGRARIKAGQVEEGLALLDEAMVGIAAGDTSVRVTAWIYCSVIDACHELDELRRAREWTVALNAWCDARPQFTGAFSGVCRIHRSELLQLAGAWPGALREAQLACEQLTQGYGEVLAGAACYQLGEIHRLRGDSAKAEEAYRRASQFGWQTQPGLGLLRLAQGKGAAGMAAIRRALDETGEPLTRSRLLPGFVEIMLAVDDIAAAGEGATELAEIVEVFGTLALHGRSAYARGAVHLAGGSPERALPALRHAWRLWRDLDAPYEAARTRVLVGLACRALHDEDTAEMELDAARQVFSWLGAEPDLLQVVTVARERTVGDAGGLSPREVEVLRLVAAGRTNQAIAAELFLSDRTVGRHVSNIFAKLGVNSRTAAAAYAFDHGIR
jgi:DNA-binding CsgD family transcriptional regulator/tetratricopeptide (TPR) repeat protein